MKAKTELLLIAAMLAALPGGSMPSGQRGKITSSPKTKQQVQMRGKAKAAKAARKAGRK